MKTYTTTQGDHWDFLSLEFYGSEKYMHVLLQANPDQRAVARFEAGIVLNVPEIDTAVKIEDLPPWKK